MYVWYCYYRLHSGCTFAYTVSQTPSFVPYSTDSNLLVKYVLFNNSAAEWWMSPNTPNSNWVSWPVHRPLSDFDPIQPIGTQSCCCHASAVQWHVCRALCAKFDSNRAGQIESAFGLVCHLPAWRLA
eukprot:107658-Chlamydomonas_euryale.AAC.3